MFRLNNKGYMLVEIILASVIAFGVAYVIINLTIKLKNKNDDLLVETQVKTDQAIITNKLMGYVMDEGKDFNCNNILVNGKQITYKNTTVVDIVNEYTNISYNPSEDCKNELGKVSINISLDVPQLGKNDYDVQIEYKYEIGDMIPPECKLKADASKVSFDYKRDNEGGSGVDKYVIVKSSTEPTEYTNNNDINIAVGKFTGFVKDKAGNKTECAIDIKATKSSTVYSYTKSFDTCPYDDSTCPYLGNWRKEGDHCSCYSTCTQAQYVWNCTQVGVSGSKLIYTTTNVNPDSQHCGLHGQSCQVCPFGYSNSGSPDYCYKTRSYFGCSNGTTTDSGCRFDDSTTCPTGVECTSTTTFSCSDAGYTKINDSYCYK